MDSTLKAGIIGAAAAVVAALIALVSKFFRSQSSSAAAPDSNRSNSPDVNAGGNVSISYGTNPEDPKPREFEFKVGEETVTFQEKLRTLSQDVVKINAYTHVLGVRAEYAWINENYPNSKRIKQSLKILELSESPNESRSAV